MMTPRRLSTEIRKPGQKHYRWNARMTRKIRVFVRVYALSWLGKCVFHLKHVFFFEILQELARPILTLS